jgi:AhpD family alkylhydroperoxidase
MKPRMKNPVLVLPDALSSILGLVKAIEAGGLSKRTLDLVNLRASQINGCSFCVDMHARELKEAGESTERLWSVAAWRESPRFDGAERAALALAEAATRLSDRSDPVPDAIWEEAARQYDERALAALVLGIAAINFFNRVNVPTRQLAGGRTAAQAAG